MASDGGDVQQGLDMHRYLQVFRKNGGVVNVEIERARSTAGVVAQAGDYVGMQPRGVLGLDMLWSSGELL